MRALGFTLYTHTVTCSTAPSICSILPYGPPAGPSVRLRGAQSSHLRLAAGAAVQPRRQIAAVAVSSGVWLGAGSRLRHTRCAGPAGAASTSDPYAETPVLWSWDFGGKLSRFTRVCGVVFEPG